MPAAAIPTLRDGDVTLRPIRARDAKPLERVLLDNRSWLRQWEATYPGGGTVIDMEYSKPCIGCQLSVFRTMTSRFFAAWKNR